MTTQPTGGWPGDRRNDADSRVGLSPPPLPANRTTGGSTPASAKRRAARAPQPSRGMTLSRLPLVSRIATSLAPYSGALAHCGRVSRWTAYAIIPLALLAFLACGAFYVRLRHGPIAVDALVAPIKRGINAELTDNSVDIKGAEIRLGKSGEIEFRLRDVTVFEQHGDAVAVAPLAAVTISTAALWSARIVPARVELIDPEISLAYTDDAGLVLDPPRVNRRLPASDATAQASSEPSTVRQPTADASDASDHVVRNLNLAKLLTDASRRARRRVGATSYLTEFGIRNATVVLAYAGQKSSWTVSEASVDFDHGKRRSVISGRAVVDAPTGPWTFTFLTDESEKTDRLQVKATVRDLVPSSLAAAAPPLALMKSLNFPIGGDATIALLTNGEVETAELALEVGEGRIDHAVLKPPLDVSGGLFRLTYDGAAREWQLAPSPMKWAHGSMLFSGALRDVAKTADEPPSWRFLLDGKNGVMEAPEFSVPSVALDVWRAEGIIVPRRGSIELDEFRMAGAGGEAVLKGLTRVGASGQSSRAEVTLSAMPLATLKALWPVAIAPGARSWVGQNVSAAEFKGGSMRYETGDLITPGATPSNSANERFSVAVEFENAAFRALDGMSPMLAARGLVRVENDEFEMTVPDVVVMLADNRKVPLKSARLFSPNIRADRSDGEISFTTRSDLGPFLEAVEQLPVSAVRDAAPFPKAGDGKVDGEFKIKLPLVAGIGDGDVTIEGKAKISDGRFGKVGGQFDVQGFTLNLDLTAAALDAKGDLLVNGVPGKITAQRVFGADAALQPPVRITADLDNADRRQLGLGIDDIISGTVPVEISLQKGAAPDPIIKLKADLTNADLSLRHVGWKKVAGRSARLETDIVKGQLQKVELQNFKLAGDDIAVDGWIGLGADNKPREFLFPTFSLNVVSRLQLQGTLGPDNTWSIKANGPTFDDRDLFRSWFSVGAGGDKASGSGKPAAAANVSIEIDNVIGASEVSMRGLRLKLSTRGDKLVALDARGTLDGGAPVAIVLDQSNGRRLMVDSVDGGQWLRFVGFYPNMQGGRLKLEVNLDGRGAADTTGTLWVDDFKVLGDPVVSEVVGSADQGRPAIGGKQQVTREVFEFSKMRVPFSIGYGQFVVEDSYVKGPLVGATMRGKVDFKTKRVNIGGTYIPLQGLNGAFGGIPVLGQLISGVQGEGMFGITFAVQGPLAEPQVLVNPLSMVAPGIFRDIFQFNGAAPEVQVREDKAPAKPVSERVRASSPTEPGKPPPAKSQKPARPPAKALDGWSSTTMPGSVP